MMRDVPTRYLIGLARIGLFAWFAVGCLFPLDLRAQYQIVRDGAGSEEPMARSLLLPYAFSTETLGIGVGGVGTHSPASAPESLYFGSAFATDNGSALGLIGATDLQIPGVDRFFVRFYSIGAHYTHMRVYVDGNPGYPDERSGSNESSAGNFIEVDAVDLQSDLEMRYILPIGHFRDAAIHTYITRNGILYDRPSGAESWNPFTSGRSSIILNPHYRRQFTDVGTDESYETLYFELQVEHDNRDFVPNPHRGFLWKAAVRHDPDWMARAGRWTVAEGEINGYVPLPATAGVRQQTLALSAWSAYTLSGKNVPYYARPSLGGFYRLRGYPSFRFHDRTAIHYSAEYRVMPDWQPLDEVELLDPLKIRWWQLVGLVEAGRVAPSMNTDLLHRDMKVDFGLGIRMMFDKSIGRADAMVSEEGFSIILMVGQAF